MKRKLRLSRRVLALLICLMLAANPVITAFSDTGAETASEQEEAAEEAEDEAEEEAEGEAEESDEEYSEDDSSEEDAEEAEADASEEADEAPEDDSAAEEAGSEDDADALEADAAESDEEDAVEEESETEDTSEEEAEDETEAEEAEESEESEADDLEAETEAEEAAEDETEAEETSSSGSSSSSGGSASLTSTASTEAFESSKTVNGIKVTVKADGGVVPEGARLSVKEVKDEDKVKELAETVGFELPDGEGEESDAESTSETSSETADEGVFCIVSEDELAADGETYTVPSDGSETEGSVKAAKDAVVLDIKLLYEEDGEETEIQPDTGAGGISVTFTDVRKTLFDENVTGDEISVFHFDEDEKTFEDKELDISDGEIGIEVEHFSYFMLVLSEDVVDGSTVEEGDVYETTDNQYGYAYTDLQDAIDAAGTTGRTIRLYTDIDVTWSSDEAIDDVYTVAEGQNITLDLNGHTISADITVTESGDGEVDDDGVTVFTTRSHHGVIGNYGTLTITDEAGRGSINVTSSRNGDANEYYLGAAAVYNQSTGSLTVEGVDINAESGDDSTTKVCAVASEGDLSISGGTITAESSYDTVTGIQLFGGGTIGEVEVEVETTASGVWARGISISSAEEENDDDVNISDCSISVKGTDLKTSGIEVCRYRTLVISNTELICEMESGTLFGLRANPKAIIEASGCTISVELSGSDASSADISGVSAVDYSEVSLEYCEITAKASANASSVNVRGLFLLSGSSMTVDECDIEVLYGGDTSSLNTAMYGVLCYVDTALDINGGSITVGTEGSTSVTSGTQSYGIGCTYSSSSIPSKVSITDCEIESIYYGVLLCAKEAEISGSTSIKTTGNISTAKSLQVYSPTSLTISDADVEITSENGIAVNMSGDTLIINAGTYKAYKNAVVFADGELTINGGTFTSESAVAVSIYDGSTASDEFKLIISGGELEGSTYGLLEDYSSSRTNILTALNITGGRFTGSTQAVRFNPSSSIRDKISTSDSSDGYYIATDWMYYSASQTEDDASEQTYLLKTDGGFASNAGTYYKNTSMDGSITVSVDEDELTADDSGVYTLGYEAYTGSAITFDDITVSYDGTTLTKGTEYSISYSNNTEVSTDDSTASFTIVFAGEYTGNDSITVYFSIVPIDASDAVVIVDNQYYTGDALTPDVTVTLNGTTLTQDTDYTVEYVDNTGSAKEDSTATVKVTFIGNYSYKDSDGNTATKTAEFTILANKNYKLSSSTVEFGEAVEGGLSELSIDVTLTDTDGNKAEISKVTGGNGTFDVTYSGNTITVVPSEELVAGEYTATLKVIDPEDGEHTLSVSITVGHDYGDPEWEWSDDYSSATATFTCSVCGDGYEVTTEEITSETDDDGNTVYTATVTGPDDVEYTDTQTVEAEEEETTESDEEEETTASDEDEETEAETEDEEETTASDEEEETESSTTSTTSKTSSSSSSSSSSNSRSTRNTTSTGTINTYTGTSTMNWVKDETGWRAKSANSGYLASTWYKLEWNSVYSWYYFGDDGYMVTGWYTDGAGSTYYLHNVSDGTMGHMYTGWHLIGGKYYYFEEEEGDDQGKLYRGTTTPDGHTVDITGARVN